MVEAALRAGTITEATNSESRGTALSRSVAFGFRTTGSGRVTLVLSDLEFKDLLLLYSRRLEIVKNISDGGTQVLDNQGPLHAGSVQFLSREDT